MSSPFSQNFNSQSYGLNKSLELKNQIKVFKQALHDNGVDLSFNEEPHILTQEQALVVRDLENYLNNSKEDLQNFIAGFKLMCKKEKYLKKGLHLTNLKKTSNDCLSGTQQKVEQESLFRILLKIASLQKVVIEIILDEIAAVCGESLEDTSYLRLLLNTFRYLPYIKDPEQITTKLIDILEIATYPAQLEILDTIPEIIPDSQFSETTKQLCKLLDEKDELTGAIIDCLNALDLDNDMKNEVQDRVLERISSGTSLKDFPILLSFLMSDCKSQNSVPILLKIRNALDTIMLTSDKSKEKETSKILIFNKLQSYTLSSKAASESWLNMISSIKSHNNHKPIDYLIIFMLYKMVPFKKRIIEAIFKKRVHNGLFKIDLLEKMFEKYLPQQLLKDYLSSMVEIGCSLLRYSTDQNIREFSSTLFKLLFNHEYTESIYRREILNSLIVLTGASSKGTVSCVLSIIQSFLNNAKKLTQHVIILMRLLEKLDSLEPSDVKIVFEILCNLTCGPNVDDSMSGMQNEIHIIVRKQLCSTKKSIKYRGIIAAVVMARCIAKIPDNLPTQSLPPSPIKNLSKLPKGRAREAGTLLELANTCSVGYPDLMGLYYDQLASMLIANHHLDNFFLAWLYETITADFTKIYVTKNIPDPINGVEMSMQYTLNSSREEECPLGINISGLTLAKNPAIMVLAPYFRLLRLLHYRQQNGELSTIDALLGCSVILPKVDDIDFLDTDEVNQLADCYFHCANWFRELISGFVTQKEKKLRFRVVKRLENLIEIENLIKECIAKSPEHKFPSSYFDTNSESNKMAAPTNKPESKTKNPKKKMKSTPTVEFDDTVNTTAAPTQQTQPTKKKQSVSKVVVDPKIIYRDLDTDAILLLKYPLKIEEDASMESTSTQSTKSVTLDFNQLKFLLKDLVVKLVITTQNKNHGLSHLNEIVPLHIISDIGFVLPNLDSHLKVIIDNINKLLEEHNGKIDGPEFFTPFALDLKACFGFIMEAFLLIFGWTGFQHSSNLEVLKNMLKSIRLDSQSQPLHSAQKHIIEFINRLAGYTDHCLELQHAVYLLKTIQALYSIISPVPEIQKKISVVSEKLLNKRWYNQKGSLESGRATNLNIDVLVKAYLSSANVATICGLVGTLQDEIEKLKSKEDFLDMLNSIDKQNFHVFYNGLCSALLNRIKIELESLTNNQHLELWNNATLTMQGLMTIAKIQETKNNLVCFLKKSIGILKVFLSHGIPMMELMLRSKPDEVVTIFKTMQTTTRFLHHLCCYTKVNKDASLMLYVPQFRLTLEQLVYSVKATLVANNCSTAFWMGNLKNKDLQGEDILSQSTIMTDENNEDSEQELPPDDSDEDLLNADNDDGTESSEVFD